MFTHKCPCLQDDASKHAVAGEPYPWTGYGSSRTGDNCDLGVAAGPERSDTTRKTGTTNMDTNGAHKEGVSLLQSQWRTMLGCAISANTPNGAWATKCATTKCLLD